MDWSQLLMLYERYFIPENHINMIRHLFVSITQIPIAKQLGISPLHKSWVSCAPLLSIIGTQ